MARALGRGRYVYGTYPDTGGAAGGAGGLVPLSRQRFIDGDTTQPGLNGAAAAPFKTIEQFIASRTNSSVEDASANYVGWLTPALGGYSGPVVFPPNAVTEIRSDSFASLSGTNITGDATWNNAGGAHVAAQPIAALHNVFLSGDFTVTDDGAGPVSIVVVSGDELNFDGAGIGGDFDATGASKLGAAIFTNVLLSGDVNTGEASLELFNSTCTGNVLGDSVDAVSSDFASSTINVTGSASFSGCSFLVGSSPVLTAALAQFDGTSWLSFLSAGGSRGATPVLVVGGYSGGAVAGLGLIASGAAATVSLDGTGGPTIPGGGNHYTIAPGVAAPVSVTLLTAGALPGDTILITKTDTAAEAIAVKNSVGTTIGIITSANRGFLLAQFGTEWTLAQCGALPA